MDISKLIQDNPTINITVNASDLMEFSQSLARQTAQETLNLKKDNLLTQKETLEKFQITVATLWRWNKFGIIKSSKVGGRVYYPETEIQRVLSLRSNS
jgi:predicted DNA-binding transcriptional regulator AlpA